MEDRNPVYQQLDRDLPSVQHEQAQPLANYSKKRKYAQFQGESGPAAAGSKGFRNFESKTKMFKGTKKRKLNEPMLAYDMRPPLAETTPNVNLPFDAQANTIHQSLQKMNSLKVSESSEKVAENRDYYRLKRISQIS